MPKSLRIKRLASLLGYTLFFLVIPIIIVNEYYDIFETNTKTSVKITGGLIITGFIIVFFFKSLIRKGINALEPGALKLSLHAVFKALPIGVLYILLLFTRDSIDRLINCTQWVFVSLCISFIIEGYYNNIEQEIKEVKLTKRQIKYKEKYNL